MLKAFEVTWICNHKFLHCVETFIMQLCFFQVQSSVNLFPIPLHLILCTFMQTNKLKSFLTLKFLFPTSSQLPSPVKLPLYFFFHWHCAGVGFIFHLDYYKSFSLVFLIFYLSFQVITQLAECSFKNMD